MQLTIEVVSMQDRESCKNKSGQWACKSWCDGNQASFNCKKSRLICCRAFDQLLQEHSFVCERAKMYISASLPTRYNSPQIGSHCKPPALCMPRLLHLWHIKYSVDFGKRSLRTISPAIWITSSGEG